MNHSEKLELVYKEYIEDLPSWLPEGIIKVDLELLQELDLLTFKEQQKGQGNLTHYFQVIEQKDKMTLINDQFVIWIVPSNREENPITYTLVGLNHEEREPELELAFSVSGVYNSSKMVMQILEKFLAEIQENEDILRKLRKGLELT